MNLGGRLALGLAAMTVIVGCGRDPAALDATVAVPEESGSMVGSTSERNGPTGSPIDDSTAPAAVADADAEREAGAAAPGDGTPASFPVGIEPTHLTIPSVGVDADVIDLTLSGPEPEVPDDFAQTGWYHQTREPGEIGPAVIAGHIDSVDGPAVFARLDELGVGDEIIVEADDGEQRRFVVTGSGQYPKGALPVEVFGFGEPVPELRLITCGGTFDRSTGHYRDNYVVYATLDG